jgi:hypothetical protein
MSLLEEFGMEIMPNLDDASPSEIKIEEIETKRDANQEVIEKSKRK